MEPKEYLVLLIDPTYLDTHNRLSDSSSRTGAALSARAETQSNASSHSLSSSTSTTTTYSNSNSHASSTSSAPLSPPRKNYRAPRSKSKSASASSSRSRSESRSSDGSLPSILRLAGLKVLISETFEEALALLEHRPPTESRPVILLVDVDTEPDLVSPHFPGSFLSRPHRPVTHKGNNSHNSNAVEPAKLLQVNGQRHLRATGDSTASKGSYQRGRRTPNNAPKQNRVGDALCGLDFLETVLQGLAKGTLHHVVPVAISSTSSQDRILELFNLGVADVLLKPVEEQAARTLFLNAHRYNKHKTAITIPRYATQKNSLALPGHTRLRNVFLQDQWLSDILVSHYCPTPTKMSLQDFPSMSSNGAQERVDELKARLLSWDFHPHDLCEDDLMRCVVIVVQEVMKLDGLGDLNIPEHLLHRFVVGLRDSYHRSNPYHNFAHAVDVLQATFYFLCRMGKLSLTGSGYPPLSNVNGHTSAETQAPANIPTDSAVDGDARSRLRVQDFLRPEDIFALIVASIGHDVGHPGVNNMFLINAHTPLAQIYNDRSVLESFHSMALFQVMKKHGFECFDVDSQNRKFLEFRKMVVSTILATDMGLHFDYVGKIKEQTERIRLRGLPGSDAPKPNQASIDEQERLVLCGTLIKCADISNASRPFHVAERWSTVLLQEMCNQADIEKEMAVCSGSQSVPAGSTKSLANDRGMQIDSQLGFIHGFAMPLFSSVKAMIPEMGYCVDFLQINHQIWQDRKTEYLKNGGGSIFTPLSAAKAGNEDEVLAEKVTLTPPKMATNHGRAKTPTGKGAPQSIPSNKDGIKTSSRKGQQSAESDSGRQSLGSDLASPIKPRGGNTRRSRSAVATETSESSPSLSSIPRPRTRTKTAVSDDNAQDARQNGRQGRIGVQQGGHSQLSSPREPNSRVRTVTSATTLSIPVSSDFAGPRSGLTSVKARSRPVSPMRQQQQQPNTPMPSKQSSPGRRSRGHSQGDNSQGQHVKQKTNGLLHGELGPRQDQPEPPVLGSPLSVSTPSLSVVAAETSPSISSAAI